MTSPRSGRSVTVLIQRDGTTKSRSLRIRLWTLKLATGVAATAILGLLLLGVFYGPIVRAAARVPGLEREVARLTEENARVRELSAAVDSLEQRYVQLRAMIGADIVRDPMEVATSLPVAPAIWARVGERGDTLAWDAGGSAPAPRWPLDEGGYLTRGQVRAGQGDEAHPGIDIAVAAGTLVRASHAATVRQVGEDPEYGLFVLLDHPNEYQTMYGHLSRIVVTVGKAVAQGEVVGLTGNTGRSTAPHLHFEVRHRGASVDPLTIVKKEGR